MRLVVDKNSSISLFDQIYRELESRILTGILEPEMKLPSLRKMCHDSGVSLMTMVKVYDQLEANGLVEKIHGSGTFVKYQRLNLTASQAEQDIRVIKEAQGPDDVFSWQTTIADYVSRAGFRYDLGTKYSFEGLNLSVANLGGHLLPTRHILSRFSERLADNDHLEDPYPPLEGTGLMRQAAVDFVARMGIKTTIDETMITVGSQQAISLIARTFIGSGDVVVVGAPTFPGALDIFKTRGAIVLEVPLDDEGMDTLALLSLCETHQVKMVYTMPNFQNPTGAVMSLERKRELLDLADEFNFMILEDDVYSQMVFEGTALPLKALDTKGRVLYVCGFSKLYGHAFRLSALFASKIIYKKILTTKSIESGGAPLINQLLLASYINSSDQKHYITDLTDQLKDLNDRVYQLIKTYFPTYVKVTKPKGGMVYWLTFPRSFNCNLLLYKCIENHKISFLPGEFCYAGKQGKNQMRLCFTSAEEDQLSEAIKHMGQMIEELSQPI